MRTARFLAHADMREFLTRILADAPAGNRLSGATLSDSCFQYIAIFIACHRTVPPVTPYRLRYRSQRDSLHQRPPSNNAGMSEAARQVGFVEVLPEEPKTHIHCIHCTHSIMFWQESCAAAPYATYSGGTFDTIESCFTLSSRQSFLKQCI